MNETVVRIREAVEKEVKHKTLNIGSKEIGA
jgi:hypothetical protein